MCDFYQMTGKDTFAEYRTLNAEKLQTFAQGESLVNPATFIPRIIAVVSLGVVVGSQWVPAQALPAPNQVMNAMVSANDYFMKKWPDPGHDITVPGKKTWPSHIWTRAVYYEGLLSLYKRNPDERYYRYAVQWGEAHQWGLRGGAKTRNADNQCCGQAYIDLYLIDRKPERIREIKDSIDHMLTGDKVDDWSWIDAIQMAMPIFAKLGVLQGDNRYLERMHELYQFTRNSHGGKGLYNPADRLWWRDKDFVAPYKEPNGEDCYWSRGNGWVFAALVRVLDVLPTNAPHRDEYLQTFKEMAEALVPLQRADGFWSVSLHDSGNYGGKELTGTALFVYGMTWGINNGHLSRDTFGPVVAKAWNAMVTEGLHKDGKLGYVQGTGKEPRDGQPVTYDSVPDFEDYGLGCFLLAGSEVYRLSGGGTSVPAKQLTVTAVNRLPFARSSQTLVLGEAELAPLNAKTLDKIHVQDAAGAERLCQAVDTDGDGRFDQVIFQSDFAGGETRRFTVFVGKKYVYTRDQFKAFGRFVRERFDDFAWENDRIAHRMYGRALESWKAEPLTSSTVDVWAKRVPRMVINDWYMTGDYHHDTGDGADFYSAGTSRGMGGNGLWAAGQLWTSRNFMDSRVLASGPIRVMFELTYEPFDVNGTAVAEVKRITLDAGSNLNYYQSFYRPAVSLPLVTGIGIKKVDVTRREMNLARGTLTTWEPVKADRKGSSHFGGAVIVDPKCADSMTEDNSNILVLAKVPASNVAAYWAGFGWDQGGHFADYEAWKNYVNEFAQGLAAPIEVSIAVP